MVSSSIRRRGRDTRTVTVTKHYGISVPVPFADINVHADTKMFVDAYAIRIGKGPQPYIDQANACTSGFFDEVTRCVVSNMASHRRAGLELLTKFEEPKETRLGLARFSFDGHGGGDGIGQVIWDALESDANALVTVGVLKQIEDLPMFVAGVADDITSDLTTRVIYGVLADFTAEMARQYPELSGDTGLRTVRRQVWDPVLSQWSSRLVELPTVEGRPLLLIPNEWVRPRLTLSAARLYETALLSYVQHVRTVYDKAGKPIRTPKHMLKREHSLRRDYATIIRIVEQAYGKGTNIVENFKRFAKERYRDAA